jgi:hypothetical protein
MMGVLASFRRMAAGPTLVAVSALNGLRPSLVLGIIYLTPLVIWT